MKSIIGNEDWRTIRRLRARPPGLAREDEARRQVFQAALAQAEELWVAASVVGAASRPLPLFYCVSQATRAICAAWLEDERWQLGDHGLSEVRSDDRSVLLEAGDVLSLAVQKKHTKTPGAFQSLARATGSAMFDGAATISELWASLPGLPTPRRVFGSIPRVLLLSSNFLSGLSDYIPQIAVPHRAILLNSSSDEVSTMTLADYPSIGKYNQTEIGVDPATGGSQPVLVFPDASGKPRPLHEVGDPFLSDKNIFGVYAVRPRVGSGKGSVPSQLVTLWALLFGLSVLARYHPAPWVGALDPDHAETAVTLEHGLDLALERTPALLSSGLSNVGQRVAAILAADDNANTGATSPD